MNLLADFNFGGYIPIDTNPPESLSPESGQSALVAALLFPFSFFLPMTDTKTLRLPERYPPFDPPVLMVCIAQKRAQPYLFAGTTVTALPLIKTPATDYEYTDLEGFLPGRFGSASASRPGADQHNKEHYTQVFLNFFSEQLVELEKRTPFHQIALFVPPPMKNMVLAKLPAALREKCEIVAGNFFKTAPLELLKRYSQNAAVAS